MGNGSVSQWKIILYFLLQWTWGIPQNIIGGVLFLACIKKKHARFMGAAVTTWHFPYSAGCGMFIFINDFNHIPSTNPLKEKRRYDLLVHEYGHTLQSLLLGPFYLPVIALPSIIWATLPFFQKLRKEKRISYYDFYCERWANHLGDTFCNNLRLQ